MSNEERKPSDDRANALEALASGEDAASSETGSGFGQHEYTDEDAMTDSTGSTPFDHMPIPAEPTGGREARQATYNRKSRKAHNQQMKKFMVPVLLVTGLILELIGGLSLIIFLQGKQNVDAVSDSAFADYAPMFMAVSFPLGFILLVGAFLFIAQLRKAPAS
ncbi:MAG: hypothetical protein ACLFVU_07455 [Phycisphaerae bacterium]